MATTFETTQTVARVYAEALLALATERGQLDEVEGQLRDLMQMWQQDSAFAALMCSAAIDTDARRGSLGRIFKNRVNELVLNALLVLNDKGRSMLLPAVCEAFARLCDAQRGRQQAFVTSAVALSDDERRRVADEARRLSGREPLLVETVDAGLLGGLILRVGDRVVDGSLRLRLRHMRQNLRRTMDTHLHDTGERFVRD
jgi:F-type H+-transporting ATPase subunit delta